MRRPAMWVVMFAVLACTVPVILAQQTNSLAQMKAMYESGKTKIDKDCEAQKISLVTAYGKAIDATLKKLSLQTLRGKGDHKGHMALKDEKARFDKEASVPEPGVEEHHPIIEQAIADYVDALHRADTTKAARAGALAKKYVATLDELAKTFTKQGNLAAASEAKQEAEAVRPLIPAEP